MESPELRDAVHELWKRQRRVGPLPVVGQSMRPLLDEADEVVVRFGLDAPPRVGDVVAFSRDGTTIVHRVLARRRRHRRLELLERGDSSGAGTWIPIDSVLGVVSGRLASSGLSAPLEAPLAARVRAVRSLAIHLALRATAAIAGRPVSLRLPKARQPAPVAETSKRRLDDAALGWMVRAALAPTQTEPPPPLEAKAAAELVRLAERHRVAPLLRHALARRGAITGLPAGAAARLDEVYYATAARGARIAAEIRRLGAAFDALSIPWLSLKGVPMAARLWGNVALRPTDDVDLLVREEDVDRAVAVLGELGYVVRDPRATARQRAWHYQVILDRPGALPSCLELHWALADRFSLALFDLEGIWSRSRGHQLDPLDEAVYLAQHLDKHGWLNRLVTTGDDLAAVRRLVLDPRSENRLLWFADLARSLERPGAPLDAAALAARAQSWHVQEALARALVVLDRLSPDALPARFGRLLPQRPRSRRAERSWRRWLAATADPAAADSPPARSWLTERGTATGFRPLRLLDGWRYVFPPRPYLELRYPASRAPAAARLAHLVALTRELRAIVAGLFGRG